MLPKLQLKQTALGDDRYRVEITSKNDGEYEQSAQCEFSLDLTAQHREDIRWYLEDYLQHPFDPAPIIAERIEKRMVEIGTYTAGGSLLSAGVFVSPTIKK